MKKLIMLLMLSGVLPMTAMAQDDDMYFVPTKENVAKDATNFGVPQRTYYAGSDRSVDEYNRQYVYDYPDTMMTDSTDMDYRYTRRMSRFDDYTPSAAYWEGYRDGTWSSPWRTGWYSWYDPWYEPWYTFYDPWYYDRWYGWRSPWYYSSIYYRPWRYGWRDYYWGGRVIYYGGGYASRRNGSGRAWSRAGVSHHKTSSNRSGGNLGGYRGRSGTYRSGNNSSATTYSNNSSSSRNLGGYRSSSSSSSRSYSSGSSSSSRSYSSGGSFGGSRSGGGHSSGGGRSYGGRR